MNIARRRRSDRTGAALVEMAVLLPLLVMLTVGIWTTARAWNIRSTLDQATRDAARVAAVQAPWTSTSRSAALDTLNRDLTAASIDPALLTVCISDPIEGPGDPCGVGDPAHDPRVQVAVVYPDLALNFLFFTPHVTLRASSVTRWEGA